MTAKPINRKSDKPVSVQGYDGLLSGMVSLIEEARRVSARTVNAIITATYWEMGRRIVENEQSGRRRAGYGEALLKKLSADLTSKFGRGFSRQNLQQMRQFYRAYPPTRFAGQCLANPENAKRRLANSLWMPFKNVSHCLGMPMFDSSP